LSHLNIILGFYKLTTDSNTYAELNTHISQHLQNLSLQDSTAHIASYIGSNLRFPADQAATLFSLYLFDRNYKTQLHQEPLKMWLTYVNTRAVNGKYNLPFSEVSGKTSYSYMPRGCALSFTIRYLSFLNKVEAKKLWITYKKEFLIDVLNYSGFREWPSGITKEADIDSGPIVMGIGTSATGLGLIASKAMNDDLVYQKLKSIEFFVRNQQKTILSESILAKSIDLVASNYKEF